MALDQTLVTMVAKKDYKEFEEVLNSEVEAKMKTYLSGFTDYLEKNTFNTEQEFK